MQIHYDLEKFNAYKPVVTIGTFDGVHPGHRRVIQELVRISKQTEGESVVFTFNPHPRIVVLPQEDSLRLLFTEEEKISAMESLGIDHLVIYPFTSEFSKLSYSEFVESILVRKMNLFCLVVGYDHRFGQGRKGDFNALEDLSQKFGFVVEQLSQFLVDDNFVSSSRIREYLETGAIEAANHLLGYKFKLTGKVVEGRQLGRKIGFPTANLETFDRHKLVPGDGVYAVLVESEGRFYHGMCNIGIRPTVSSNADQRSIEVHLFNFRKNIYNTVLTIYFVSKIRNEQKFANIYELKDQLNKDEIYAKKQLADIVSID